MFESTLNPVDINKSCVRLVYIEFCSIFNWVPTSWWNWSMDL